MGSGWLWGWRETERARIVMGVLYYFSLVEEHTHTNIDYSSGAKSGATPRPCYNCEGRGTVMVQRQVIIFAGVVVSELHKLTTRPRRNRSVPGSWRKRWQIVLLATARAGDSGIKICEF